MKNVFVSSTFKDFQKERDVLNEQVLPELNMHAAQFGDSVSFCDLRWGIDTTRDTEETATKRILTVCMDEIDRSRPYMVILLGGRYGYIPGSQYIEEELRKRNISLADLEDLEISITQLEIEYGLLSRPENRPHIFIYVRTITGSGIPGAYTAESSEHRKKLDDLLCRIDRFSEGQVRQYQVALEDGELGDLSEFANMVKADLLADMQRDWQQYRDIPRHEKELRIQWNLIGEKQQKMKVHQDFAAQTEQTLLSGSSRFLYLNGPSGCGKSVLFSRLCMAARDRGWYVIPALSGSTAAASDPSLLGDYLIWHLETLLGTEHRTITQPEETASLNEKSIHNRKMEYLDLLCDKIGQTQHSVLIAVDALDQLYPHKMEQHNDFLPRSIPQNMRILVTAVPEFTMPGHYFAVPMAELSPELVVQAVAGIQQNYGKAIAPEVCQALYRREASRNLLYLTMAVMRLNMMNREDFQIIRQRGDGIVQINRRQLEIVETLSTDAEKLAVQLLENAAAVVADAGILRAMEYLAISRTGLRLTDLEALLKADGNKLVPLDFYVYIHCLKDFFLIRPNGNVDFQHKTIRHGVLAGIEDRKTLHQKLFDHLQNLPQTDPLRNEEIVYHAYYAGNRSFIPRHIADLRFNGYLNSVRRMGVLKQLNLTFPASFHPEVDYDYYCWQMASDLHSIIVSEPIMDVVEMMVSLPPEKKGNDVAPIYWLEFVTKLLPGAFGDTEQEHKLLYVVFSCMKAYAEEACKSFRDLTTKKSLALCCRKLAVLAESNPNRGMMQEALEHTRTYSRLLGEILQESDRHAYAQALQSYAESRELLMMMLYLCGGESACREAVTLGHEVLSLYAKLPLPERTARVYFNMGLAYEWLGGPENRENAYQCYIKTVTISEQYATEKKDRLSLTYRILSTLKIGDMCLEVGHFTGAQQVYMGAHTYASEMDEKYHEPQTRKHVLLAMEGIGQALLGQNTEQSRAQARTILTATLLQIIELSKEYSDPSIRDIYNRLVASLKKL